MCVVTPHLPSVTKSLASMLCVCACAAAHVRVCITTQCFYFVLENLVCCHISKPKVHSLF